MISSSISRHGAAIRRTFDGDFIAWQYARAIAQVPLECVHPPPLVKIKRQKANIKRQK
jgi:hypothetical protein